MQNRKTLKQWMLGTIVVGALAGLALGGSAGTFTGNDGMPLGVLSPQEAQGPKLSGVLHAEYTDFNEVLFTADAVRVTLRLRRGQDLEAFFAEVPGPFDTTQPAVIREAVITALEAEILATFFPDDCALGCPSGEVVVKTADELAFIVVVNPDTTRSQLSVLDITVAANGF